MKNQIPQESGLTIVDEFTLNPDKHFDFLSKKQKYLGQGSWMNGDFKVIKFCSLR